MMESWKERERHGEKKRGNLFQSLLQASFIFIFYKERQSKSERRRMSEREIERTRKEENEGKIE
jgi:hypothetical protein